LFSKSADGLPHPNLESADKKRKFGALGLKPRFGRESQLSSFVSASFIIEFDIADRRKKEKRREYQS
jgi:hypothetical protein